MRIGTMKVLTVAIVTVVVKMMFIMKKQVAHALSIRGQKMKLVFGGLDLGRCGR